MTSPIFTRRLFTGGSLLFVLSSCTTSTVLAPAENSAVSDQTVGALPLINKLRGGRRLSRLDADPVAMAAASDQAVRMCRYGEMSHFLGADKSFLDRMKRMEVKLPAAENIAAGQADVGAAMEAWIHSPKHLENMLGNYRGLGVAVARNSSSGNRPYWAMVLSNADASLFSRTG